MTGQAHAVPDYILADTPAQIGAILLIEAEVNSAEDAGIIDIVGNLLELAYRRVTAVFERISDPRRAVKSCLRTSRAAALSPA